MPAENFHLVEPIHNEYAKHIKGVYSIAEKVSKELRKVLESSNTFPIILMGDHSPSIGTVTGIKLVFPDKQLGLIWIDAHADIHSPYTTPSGNLHGMCVAAFLDEDNLDCKVNNPNAESIEYWNKLKSLGNIKPKILPSNIIYVAVRDTELQENYLTKKLGIRNYTVNEIRTRGVERSAVEILNYLEKCDIIHISFDVDSMDPSISRGTGTPAKNGITEREAGSLISRLLNSKKVISFEMAEVNPTLDHENIMAENAFEILQEAANQITRVV